MDKPECDNLLIKAYNYVLACLFGSAHFCLENHRHYVFVCSVLPLKGIKSCRTENDTHTVEMPMLLFGCFPFLHKKMSFFFFFILICELSLDYLFEPMCGMSCTICCQSCCTTDVSSGFGAASQIKQGVCGVGVSIKSDKDCTKFTLFLK